MAVKCLLTSDFLDLEQETEEQVNPVLGVLTRAAVCPLLSQVLDFPRTSMSFQSPADASTHQDPQVPGAGAFKNHCVTNLTKNL